MDLQCDLCPKSCVIAPGESGDCRIRMNVDDQLLAVTYDHPCSIHVDPVEKKPLFHFLPGSTALSVATVGCNLHCKNCQNWEISQQNPGRGKAYQITPPQLVSYAKKNRCKSIAYTYTDPVVFYEYTLDCSIAARKKGIKNILVTAGYINIAPLKELCKHVDAANIDLKGFSDEFYEEICDGSLQPVLNALVTAKNAGVMVEVTNLLIPTLNDSEKMIKDLCKWVKDNLGEEVPVHFSRFFPRYRMRKLPATPLKTLDRAKKIAQDTGLQYVYLGNVMQKGADDTYCPKCGALLIERQGYTILRNNIKDGKCPKCGHKIYGVWK